MISFLKKLAITMVSCGLLSQQAIGEVNNSKINNPTKSSQSKVNSTPLNYIRGATTTGFKAELFFTGKSKLRWYDKDDYITLMKCGQDEAFLVISLNLKRGYTLSKDDYVFKTKTKTYPCLSVSSGRGFGVKFTEVEAKDNQTPVRMVYKIIKEDRTGELVFKLNSTISIPSIKITKNMIK
jgi:hypothetical protein